MKKQALCTLSYFKAEILPRNNRLPGFTIVELSDLGLLPSGVGQAVLR